MRHWLASRWVIAPLSITALVLAWNGYVALNNGGAVAGRVVDGGGRPVADATVILLERHFVMHNERQRTRTDAEGRFQLPGNDNHSLAARGRDCRARTLRAPRRAAVVSRAERQPGRAVAVRSTPSLTLL